MLRAEQGAEGRRAAGVGLFACAEQLFFPGFRLGVGCRVLLLSELVLFDQPAVPDAVVVAPTAPEGHRVADAPVDRLRRLDGLVFTDDAVVEFGDELDERGDVVVVDVLHVEGVHDFRAGRQVLAVTTPGEAAVAGLGILNGVDVVDGRVLEEEDDDGVGEVFHRDVIQSVVRDACNLIQDSYIIA